MERFAIFLKGAPEAQRWLSAPVPGINKQSLLGKTVWQEFANVLRVLGGQGKSG
jgi:hypothetical protein